MLGNITGVFLTYKYKAYPDCKKAASVAEKNRCV